MAEEKLIGEITHYFDHIGVGIIKLTKGSLRVGDKVCFRGGDVDFEQEIASMQAEHTNIEEAKKGSEFGVKVDQKVRKGYKVYLVD